MIPGAKKKLLILLAFVLTAASLTLNAWLAIKVMDYKGRLFLSRQFPDPVPLAVPADGRQTVWLVGDSRVAAWRLPETEGLRWINRGVSGFTVRQALDQFRADLAAGSAPHTVVVQAGINDVLSAGYNRPSWLPPAARRTWPDRPVPAQIIEQCKIDMAKLVAAARERGCRVLVLTVFPPGSPGWRDVLFWTDELDSLVESLNAGIRTFSGPGVSVLDTVPLLAENGRTRSANVEDSLHLNSTGYDLLTSALLKELGK